MTIEGALSQVIAYLDDEMERNPSRQLADVSNYLQELKDSL